MREMRNAARSNDSHDVYSLAEAVLPKPQSAAIIGFCLVASGRTGSEGKRLSDPAYFLNQVIAAARPFADTGSMASVRRAADKLQAFIKPESLNGRLVKRYAKACNY
jgi:hypothetical protein